MNHEQLQSTEQWPTEKPSVQTQTTELSEQMLSEVFNQRHTELQTIKNWISLKFYYKAAEKIKAEEASLRKLLDRETVKRSILSEYSFVLDPLYFEQKFLPLS